MWGSPVPFSSSTRLFFLPSAQSSSVSQADQHETCTDMEKSSMEWVLWLVDVSDRDVESWALSVTMIGCRVLGVLMRSWA
jgi:hypothetical protein